MSSTEKNTTRKKVKEFTGKELAKLAEVRINDTQSIHVRKMELKGKIYIDTRKYYESGKYTGYSKKGLWLPEDQFKKLQAALSELDV